MRVRTRLLRLVRFLRVSIDAQEARLRQLDIEESKVDSLLWENAYPDLYYVNFLLEIGWKPAKIKHSAEFFEAVRRENRLKVRRNYLETIDKWLISYTSVGRLW